MMVFATELAAPDDQFVGWGIKIVMDEFRQAGVVVEPVPLPSIVVDVPDVWLVSLPYAGNAHRIRDFFDMVGESMDKRFRDGRTVFILGGHGVINSRPFLDVFDAVFVGEADDVAQDLARSLPDMGLIAEVPGIDVGDGDVWFQVAAGLSKRGLYQASFSDKEGGDGVGRTNYLEVAKGCQAGCKFCELGWLYGYKQRTRQETADIIAKAVLTEEINQREVVLSAPDTDGVKWFADAVADGDYDPRWRSTRVVKYLPSKTCPPSGRRGRIRFGVEGVTERLRRLTGKWMSNDDLERSINRALGEGYRMLRVFIIGGLPTETAHDRRHLRDILDMFRRAKGLRHWKAADLKITGLSPQPMTPWQRLGIASSIEAIDHYRSLRRALESSDVHWRTVMVDAGNTEADVVKRMMAGELLPYLQAWNEPRRWMDVRQLCGDVGIDYDSRVASAIDGPLPWAHVRHPHERIQRKAEEVAMRGVSGGRDGW